MSLDHDAFMSEMEYAKRQIARRLDAYDADDYWGRAEATGDLNTFSMFGCMSSLAEDVARHTFRDELRKTFGWSIPTPQALNVVARHAPLLDLGAGGGYWTYLLRKRGVDVLAYDARPPDVRKNHWCRKAWTPVLHGRARKAKQFSERTLFLSWPPYSWPFAYNALSKYRGSTVIYVGEWRGCTGDDAFHDLLDREWTEVERARIPQWSGLHDELSVHRRAR